MTSTYPINKRGWLCYLFSEKLPLFLLKKLSVFYFVFRILFCYRFKISIIISKIASQSQSVTSYSQLMPIHGWVWIETHAHIDLDHTKRSAPVPLPVAVAVYAQHFAFVAFLPRLQFFATHLKLQKPGERSRGRSRSQSQSRTWCWCWAFYH